MDTTHLRLRDLSVPACVIAMVCLLATVGGCHHRDNRSWCPPNLATPLSDFELSESELATFQPVSMRPGGFVRPGPAQFLHLAELSYTRACDEEAEEADGCIESYFATVQFSWPMVETYLRDGQRTDISERAWQLYHSAVAQIIKVGIQTERFDVHRGLAVETPTGPLRIGVRLPGSVWTPRDYSQIHLVGDYAAPELSSSVRRAGVGIPLAIARSKQDKRKWLFPGQMFAATALLRPVRTGYGVAWTLELHDPMRSRGPLSGTSRVPLAYDLTAPLVYRINHGKRDYLTDFLQPGATTANIGLYMVEPYQRDKIPVIFVHGLLSDPLTWADLANAIRAQPDIMKKYQLWAYQYATGEPFLMSAAALRSELRSIRTQIDPSRRDAALEKMVLVGHSMGGLLAKLQVTSSGDRMWRSISNRPFDTLQMDPDLRSELRRSMFFEPVSHVSRVLFIGTPHRGSPWANRWIGRIGAALVEEPETRTERFAQLMADYPDAFDDRVLQRKPTSIDMLKPDNPLLNALRELPIPSRVTVNSIVGTGYVMHDGGPSDGVVPVSSAHLTAVASELVVESQHERLHRKPASIADVLRILREHATIAGNPR